MTRTSFLWCECRRVLTCVSSETRLHDEIFENWAGLSRPIRSNEKASSCLQNPEASASVRYSASTDSHLWRIGHGIGIISALAEKGISVVTHYQAVEKSADISQEHVEECMAPFIFLNVCKYSRLVGFMKQLI